MLDFLWIFRRQYRLSKFAEFGCFSPQMTLQDIPWLWIIIIYRQFIDRIWASFIHLRIKNLENLKNYRIQPKCGLEKLFSLSLFLWLCLRVKIVLWTCPFVLKSYLWLNRFEEIRGYRIIYGHQTWICYSGKFDYSIRLNLTQEKVNV